MLSIRQRLIRVLLMDAREATLKRRRRLTLSEQLDESVEALRRHPALSVES